MTGAGNFVEVQGGGSEIDEAVGIVLFHEYAHRVEGNIMVDKLTKINTDQMAIIEEGKGVIARQPYSKSLIFRK